MFLCREIILVSDSASVREKMLVLQNTNGLGNMYIVFILSSFAYFITILVVKYIS